MPYKKKIALLGATGSIGVNVLNCVDNSPEDYEIVALSTHSKVDLVLQQCNHYRPKYVAVTGRSLSDSKRLEFENIGVKVFSGDTALVDLAQNAKYEMLVNAVVGAAGFLPTLTAIDNGADIALANKETLVIGGQIVMQRAKSAGVDLLPIDSEHSAIFQSLMGESYDDIEEILLTASGGPFRNTSLEDFRNITVEQALNHPNWNMGRKITIDSATMMNKGLEVIEAFWLFGVSVDKIRVVIHPQSIIHSMVAFHDGSIKAQLGMPDMRVPIQLAMTYPQRVAADFPRIDWTQLKELTFDTPDLHKFECLSLAFQAIRAGGTTPAVMNAANEIAVAKFLDRKIGFLQIARMIEKTIEAHEFNAHPEVEDLLAADQWARNYAEAL
jgi:1-deoxy-D-xylulose-5-phosphate reductoisomerase